MFLFVLSVLESLSWAQRVSSTQKISEYSDSKNQAHEIVYQLQPMEMKAAHDDSRVLGTYEFFRVRKVFNQSERDQLWSQNNLHVGHGPNWIPPVGYVDDQIRSLRDALRAEQNELVEACIDRFSQPDSMAVLAAKLLDDPKAGQLLRALIREEIARSGAKK